VAHVLHLDYLIQEPVRLMLPRRWNATASHTVITLPLKLPGVALLHLCDRAALPPYQVSPSHHIWVLTQSYCCCVYFFLFLGLQKLTVSQMIVH